MNPQLQILIALQDVLSMIKEAKDPTQKKAFGKMGFKIDNPEALEKTRIDLESKLNPIIRSHYNRAKERYGKVVAPVIDGICYGCFVRIPSAIDTAEDRNETLYRCENCGMFLYWVDK